jgi:SAM-dependent methyltransferase
MGSLHLLRRLVKRVFGDSPGGKPRERDAVPETAFLRDEAPAGHMRWRPPARSEAYREIPVAELAQELIFRIEEGQGLGANQYHASIGARLLFALERDLDVHANVFARQKVFDLFGLLHRLLPVKPTIRGATFVELGPGSVNPFALLFVFLMLGAKRGIAFDHDAIQDESAACRAMAATAAAMLLDPTCIVHDYEITRTEVLENIASFDLGKLRRGDPGGLDRSRLVLLRESVDRLSLPDGSADVVISNAFFEHVTRVERALAELARITRTGGIHVHHVDVSDHVRYTNKETHPLDFLRLRPEHEDGLVNGSNRLRVCQFRELFERAGFDVLDCRVPFEVPVTDEFRETFVEPFRSMRNEDLVPTNVVLLARKR